MSVADVQRVTVGEASDHAKTIIGMASSLLTGLAMGHYKSEEIFVEDMLGELGVFFPQAIMAERALKVFLFLNKLSAPRAKIVSDGQGGFVPESNSRYDPKTGEFL